MKLIVGLGNPGKQYENTRHNVGFRAVDGLSGEDIRFRSQNQSLVAKGAVNTVPVFFAKPQTFMNLSGDAVLSLLAGCQCHIQDIIVIVDDVHLELGKIRIRAGGSHGGQNGLRDIIAKIGENFTRLRIGIGPVTSEYRDMSHYVLGQFSKEEQKKIADVLEKIPDAIDCIISQGVLKAQSLYNS